MTDITLSTLLANSPVSTDLDGDEPLETVISGVSRAFTLRQLSSTPLQHTTTNVTLNLATQGAVLSMSNDSAANVTVPLNSAVALPIGATLLVRSLGLGDVSIVAEAGVTIIKRASSSNILLEQYAQCVLHKINTNIWHLAGELRTL